MGKATVAIILSNYNHGRYLPESLGGIGGQTRQADEIVVIDDGSTDDSVAVIEEFARTYPGVRFLRNERNLGLQESITRALPLITSDYLVWAAADDRLLPQFLEKSMAVLERHPEAGLCFSELSVLQGDSGVIERFALNSFVQHIFDLSDLPEYMTPDQIMRRMRRAFLPITSNSVVVRRDALLGIGGYPKDLEWHSDHFAYTVIALRHGVCVVPETLALIRANAGSYSQIGMRDPLRQTEVLEAMLEMLGRPDYRDIRRAFRRCPSNFSPWHTLILKLQLRRVRDWDLFVPYLTWKIREYKRGHQLGWPTTIGRLGLRLLRSVRVRVQVLTAERDGLQRELQSARGELAAEREHLRSRLAAVEAVRDELEGRLNAAILERERARDELRIAARAREALRAQADARARVRDELETRLQAVIVESEEMRRELQGTAGARDEMEAQVKAVSVEKEHLGSQLEAAGLERDNLSGQVGSLQAELDGVKGELRQIHSDYVSVTKIAEEYKSALAKMRVPPMLITTMPKSGTYYLSKLFGEGLFIETRIVSHQYFPYDVIRQPELRALSRGSCVSQDHFGASKINLAHIARHVDRLVVHLRDPRQATLSYTHFLDTQQFRRNEEETLLFIYPPLPDDYYQLDFGAKLDWGIANWLPLLVEWTEEWVAAAASRGRTVIKFTRYEDLVADRDVFVRDVLAFFGIPLDRFFPPRVEADEEVHFRKGEIDEWRTAFTPEQIEAANAKIPRGLAERFGWPRQGR